MLQRPRFKPHIQVERVKGDGVFLLWETGQAVLHGPIYEAVAPLIDGQRSSDEIVEKLSADTPLARIYYALHQLESRGYLMEADDSVPAHEAALWSIQGIDPVAARQRLAVSSVELRMVGGVEEHEAPFKAALEALGVRTSAAGDLLVVLTDDYLRDALRQVNQGRLERERPWLIARPVGRQIWMGPVFVPRKGACWECLAQRLRVNRPTDRYVNLQRREGGESAPVARAATVASTMVAWNVVATEVASILARECRPESTSSILTLDVVKWSTERHTVVRLPHCPACGKGESSSQPGLPIVFANQKKLFTRDGGHRVVTPDTTLARYAHHVSPITGVVTSLSRSGPPGDGVLHVYESGQNPDQVYADLASLRRGLRSGKSGKGASDTQARASALCEGLERHSGIFRGDEPRRLARLADLGDAAIHPNACMLFSERQYRERDRWNGRDTRYNYVPAPLSDDAVVSFTPAWSLTRKRVRYLPTALCYYGFVDPSVEPFAMTCSNGTAAGNTVDEAILQGFLELVERDSVALWWYNRARRPRVDLDSFNDPYIGEVVAYLRARHRDLWVLDLTSDLGIPVFAALSRRLDEKPERILLGFGAHLDPRIALLRAITELNQMTAWVSPMEKTPPEPLEDGETMSWLAHATVERERYLAGDPRAPVRRATDFPRKWHDDLRDDLLLCQSLVEAKGMEMLVLDQSRTDIGLSAVKVFVPGLRHFWARFASGRLYDVPVELGWRDYRLSEDELNPIPMFI